MKPYFIGNIRKLKFTPNVGLEPTTLRLGSQTDSHDLYRLKPYFIGNIRKLKFTPNVGLEPTLRLRVSCSTD